MSVERESTTSVDVTDAIGDVSTGGDKSEVGRPSSSSELSTFPFVCDCRASENLSSLGIPFQKKADESKFGTGTLMETVPSASSSDMVSITAGLGFCVVFFSPLDSLSRPTSS